MNGVSSHIETFRMRSYDLDAAGRVGLGAMCRYLQEAASNHAAALDVALERLEPLGLAWVLGRLHLRLERVPRWGEEIRVETWPSGRDTLRATRDFLLETEAGEVFARATTAWTLVDVARRRPVRLPDFVLEIHPPERARALDDAFEKIPELEAYEISRALPIRRADIDLNGHVNNARYVDLLLEALPESAWPSGVPRSLEIAFRAEIGPDDSVVSESAPDPGHEGARLHRVRVSGATRSAALARLLVES